MGWRTVEAVDDAVEATRRFLFPFHPVRWATLAVLVFVMGSSASVGAVIFVVTDVLLTGLIESALVGGTGVAVADTWRAAGVTANRLSLAVVVVAGGTAVAFSVASLTLRLAFYDALRTNTVRVVDPFLDCFRQAIGLFVAVTTLRILVAAPIVVSGVVGFVSATPIVWAPADVFVDAAEGLSVESVFLGGVLASLAVLGAWLALRLTYEFVVPVMVADETGVLAGWERVGRAVSTEWREALMYLVVHFFVGLGTALVETVVIGTVGVGVAAASGVALLFVAVSLGGVGALVGTTAGVVAIVVVTVVAVVTLLALTVPISVLTRSYVIAYEVTALGGIDQRVQLLTPDADTETVRGD